MDMQKNVKVNFKYKDSLFRFIFRDKAALLTLYNAVNDSDYTDPEALEIYTMEDFVYMNMKNDLSFLIDWNMNVFEHQSTYNPNMPLRGFLYMAAAFKKYIALNRLDIYGSKRLSLPVPGYYVFYNGFKELPDEEIWYLTESMEGTAASEKSCVQFKAHMVNINMGKNSKLMERCPLLYEYSVFVSEIRKRISQNALLREAVEGAVDYCIHNGILADVLRGNRAEVTDMCLEEYDAAFHIASEKEISFEEGRSKGRQEERRNTERERQRADELELKNAVLVGKLRGETEEAIAKSRGITLKEVKRILEEA